jgi:iron-sulfur cluster insertion protein
MEAVTENVVNDVKDVVAESGDAILKRDMTIGDVLQKWPAAAPILTEKGIHCVGCDVSAFETIEEGFRSHGMTEEQIDQTLADVNQKLALALKEGPKQGEKMCGSEPKGPATLHIADEAATKVLGIMEKEGKDPKETVLRIAVLPGGCAGFKYDFSFAKFEKNSDDVLIEKNGLNVLIDEQSLDFVNGSTVEYTDGLHGAGFVVTNPQAKGGCGCGKSFN